MIRQVGTNPTGRFGCTFWGGGDDEEGPAGDLVSVSGLS